MKHDLAIMQRAGGFGQRGLPFAGPLRNRSRRRGIYSPPNTPVGTEDVVREALLAQTEGEAAGGVGSQGCSPFGPPCAVAVVVARCGECVGMSMDGRLEMRPKMTTER